MTLVWAPLAGELVEVVDHPLSAEAERLGRDAVGDQAFDYELDAAIFRGVAFHREELAAKLTVAAFSQHGAPSPGSFVGGDLILACQTASSQNF